MPVGLDIHDATAKALHPTAPLRGQGMAGEAGKEPHGMGEETRVRMLGAAYFFACHRVAGEKAGLTGATKKRMSAFRYGHFDAAYVGYQLMRLEEGSEFLNPVEDGEDGPTQKHEVARDRSAEWIGGGYIDRPSVERDLRVGGRAIPACDLARELRGPEREPGGCTDEARAEDGDALDGHGNLAMGFGRAACKQQSPPVRAGVASSRAGPSFGG
jgi:hypothetical protein